ATCMWQAMQDAVSNDEGGNAVVCPPAARIASAASAVITTAAVTRPGGWRVAISDPRVGAHRIRHDELVLIRTHDANGTGCVPHDGLGHTAHQQMRHRAAAMRAHDDEVHVGLLRVFDDRVGRVRRHSDYRPGTEYR